MIQWGMKKSDAIQLLGGSITAAAKAIGVSYQAVNQWPDELSRAIEDRVIAAVARQNPKIQRLLSPKEAANA
ncbi:Uncharacterised protein [Achromobacter xylosoxidans]|nr:Uncharacterised protein [Achromobacter xylosoxidans]